MVFQELMVILILFSNLCEEKRLSYCWRSDSTKSKQIAKVHSGSDIGKLYFRSVSCIYFTPHNYLGINLPIELHSYNDVWAAGFYILIA